MMFNDNVKNVFNDLLSTTIPVCICFKNIKVHNNMPSLFPIYKGCFNVDRGIGFDHRGICYILAVLKNMF